MGAPRRILLACLAAMGSFVSNTAAQRVGVNLSGANSYEYGHTYLDWSRRFAQTFFDGASSGGSTPATLKANGSPAASYHYTLQANALAADVTVYDCWMPGSCDAPGTGTGLQLYYGGTQQVGAFSGFAYNAGADQTTFTLTIPGTSGPIIVVTNPTSTADYIRIIPRLAGVDKFINANDFHPDMLARLRAFGVASIRGMDWFDTNNSTDTNWAGSIMAGGDGSIRQKSRSLGEFLRLANVLAANVHVCFPRAATSDLYTNAFALIGSVLPTNKTCTIELSDEPWNPIITNNLYYMQQMLPAAGTYTGVAAAGPTILSVVRASNVVTITLSSAPGAITSCVLVGITNITGGLINSSNGISVSGSTITYNEIGANVTGTIITSSGNFGSYLQTNLTHRWVKASTIYGNPTSNFGVIQPSVMLFRYMTEQLRAVWTIVQTLTDKARYRFILNQQPGVAEFTVYSYAIEQYGDSSWITEIMCAPYFSAPVAGKTTAQIIASLLASAVTRAKQLVQEANAAAAFGHGLGFYEGGPATNGGTSADTANIGAAQYDAGMGTTLTQMLGYGRDLGLSDVFHYFKDGCSFNYATHIESDNEQGWNVLDVSNTDLTKPKPQALIGWAAADSTPKPFTAALHPEVGADLTWGTINMVDVCGMSSIGSISGGALTFSTTTILPDVYVLIVPPPGQTTATLSLFFGSAAGAANDWCTVALNGTQLAFQQVLTSNGSGYPAPTVPFFTGTVTVIPGQFNWLKLSFKPVTRSQFMAFYRVVIG